MGKGFRSLNMLCKAVLVLAIIQCPFGLDVMETAQRQEEFSPPTQIQDSLLTALDTPEETGIVIYPTLLGNNWDLQQIGLNTLDTEESFNTDSVASPLNSDEEYLQNQLVLQKRPNIKLIPRIGRKKRSLTAGQSEEENKSSKGRNQGKSDDTMIKPIWEENNDQEYLFRTDKRKARRVVFIPRIGKKNFADRENLMDKRAVLFIPKIGRATFLPQTIRRTPKYRVTGRAIFIPRIG